MRRLPLREGVSVSSEKGPVGFFKAFCCHGNGAFRAALGADSEREMVENG